MGRDSNAYASVAGGSLKLKVDDSGKIKKSKKKKKKKSKNRSRSASPEMGKGLNKIDKEPNYRFAKDIKANVSSEANLGIQYAAYIFTNFYPFYPFDTSVLFHGFH